MISYESALFYSTNPSEFALRVSGVDSASDRTFAEITGDAGAVAQSTGPDALMFKKVLIANRGEIALRVIRACRELGRRRRWRCTPRPTASRCTSASPTTTSASARRPAAQSYLKIPSIIAAAEITGADAIHPGYGFLAENAEFAETCRRLEHHVHRPHRRPDPPDGRQGDRARGWRRKPACRPCPARPAPIEDPDEALAFAEEIGFPVIIKAAAGGGGKGMRIAQDAEQFAQLVRAGAERGAGRVRQRRGLRREVPAAARGTSSSRSSATSIGNVVHLGERDCSVQRRHQKLIEESPSPALDARRCATRMGEAAVALASNIGYVGAGTIEFLLDNDGSVLLHGDEHPDPGGASGHRDGHRLRPGEGADPRRRRRAAQLPGRRSPAARATRSSAGSTPRIPTATSSRRPGLITAYHPPGGPGVRVDTHVYAGYTVPPYYDSLLAKVIVHGNDRRGGADPDGPGARQLHPRGRHHHDPVPRPGDPSPGLRRRRGGHPVPRARVAPASPPDV